MVIVRDLYFLTLWNMTPCFQPEAVCCINASRTADVPALLLNTGFSHCWLLMWNISTLFFSSSEGNSVSNVLKIHFLQQMTELQSTAWTSYHICSIDSFDFFTKLTWRDFIFYRFQSKSIKKTICHSGVCGSSNTFQKGGNIDWNSDSATGSSPRTHTSSLWEHCFVSSTKTESLLPS